MCKVVKAYPRKATAGHPRMTELVVERQACSTIFREFGQHHAFGIHWQCGPETERSIGHPNCVLVAVGPEPLENTFTLSDPERNVVFLDVGDNQMTPCLNLKIIVLLPRLVLIFGQHFFQVT